MTYRTGTEGASADAPGSAPLYAQVRATLRARIAAGEIAPGDALPSETALARSLGVSPGTLRKAVDALVAEGTLVRRQGRGTFVAEETDARAAYRFFRMVDAEGARALPEPGPVTVARIGAEGEAAAALGLADGTPAIRLERTRALDGRPALAETMVVPEALFEGLGTTVAVGNALYPLFQARFGVTVAAVEDRLTAVAASPGAAAALGLPEGAPLLAVSRVARDLAGRPVEWRRTLFATGSHAYRVVLR